MLYYKGSFITRLDHQARTWRSADWGQGEITHEISKMSDDHLKKILWFIIMDIRRIRSDAEIFNGVVPMSDMEFIRTQFRPILEELSARNLVHAIPMDNPDSLRNG